MTADPGKGASGKPGQRSSGADAKGGQPRKKTSAAKPPSDEVTLRAATDPTNGSKRPEKAEGTVVDAGDNQSLTEDTVQDIEAPKGEESADDAASGYDEVTTEDTGSETSVFGTPKDTAGSETSIFGKPREIAGAETSAFGGSKDHEDAKESSETGAPAPSSGKSPAMDVPRTPTPGFGGSTPSAGNPSKAPGRAATLDAAAKVAKLAGALRKPDKSAGSRKPARKAHLQVARFEPWSVMKFSFIMALVCFLVLFVAVAVLYMFLSGLGVFDALSNTIRDLTSNDQGKSGGINPANWFSAARILGYTALIGTLNVLLITALATVWSVIYNMAADLVGGVEVTLKEADQ
jgi:hypothetical protein